MNENNKSVHIREVMIDLYRDIGRRAEAEQQRRERVLAAVQDFQRSFTRRRRAGRRPR